MTGVVLDWLLDSDPALRWQVLEHLSDSPSGVIEAERARVAREGWGARLLADQRDDGNWGDGKTHRQWWSNLYTLVWLRDLGVDPSDAVVQTAIDRVRERITWGPWHNDSPFFDGESEPCINGRVVALGAYFNVRTDDLVDRLLGEQLNDGGWNCQSQISPRSSFHTTICVLEGFLAYERAFGATPGIADARQRGEDYLLERRLLRRLSNGEIINADWMRLAFPPLWHYDVLRALDYFRSAERPYDERMAEAIEVIRERRQADGRWLLDVRHKNTLYEDIAGEAGAPNMWVTLGALRVLRWFTPS